MAALGELVIFLVLLLPGLGAIGLLFWATRAKKSLKPLVLSGSILCCVLFFGLKSYLNNGHKKEQSSRAGIYYLTNYPGCESCILELKEDLTYEVTRKGIVVEKSNWRYESGGDYWITYLDNDRHQLGAGNYAYERYRLKSR